jgi:hypothetical protein
VTERRDTWLARIRDKVAYRVANGALNTIATPWYRDMLDGAMRLGLQSAERTDEWKRTVLLELLDDLHQHADALINAGDLDIDDWLWKARRLSRELKEVLND